MSGSLNQRRLLEALAEAVPEVDRLQREHLSDYGELLPHLLMADVARLVASHFGFGPFAQAPSTGDLRKILSILDRAMGTPDEAVQNLISVSFLEHLEHEPFSPELERLLGRNLRRELSARAES